MKKEFLIAIGLAAALTPLAAPHAATTVATPTTTVTPATPTTTPGSSRYFNPYTPAPDRAVAATKSPGSWEVYPSPTTKNLLAVDFVDASGGWPSAKA